MEMRPLNKRGVTLIELIVVIVIIGILGAFLAPNIGAWLPNYRLRGAARDIVSTMRTAQMRAVSTNLVYAVSFTSSTYILKYQNTLGAWVNEGATQKLPSGVSIITPIPGGNAVFNPNSTSSSGSVTLQNSKGTQRRLTLTPSTGRVTITTP